MVPESIMKVIVDKVGECSFLYCRESSPSILRGLFLFVAVLPRAGCLREVHSQFTFRCSCERDVMDHSSSPQLRTVLKQEEFRIA